MTLTTRRLTLEVVRGSHIYLKVEGPFLGLFALRGSWEYFKEL